MKEFTKKEMIWLKRLQKILDAQPTSITGFCTGKDIEFYKGELPISNYGVESRTKSERIESINWEAGAY